MTKTSLDVCTRAMRLLAVSAEGETLPAEQFAAAKDHMTDIFATLNDEHALAFDWTIETVPDGAFLAFARMVAGSIAPEYGREDLASFYGMGLRDMKRFAARDLFDRNTPATAHYF